VLRALFFWNPLLALWERALRALEDLACDSAVLARARVTPGEYGQALLWAVTAVRGAPDDRVALQGGRAMASQSTQTLRRRILMLNRPKGSGALGSNVLGICVAAGVLLGSWAVRGAVSERRLGAAEIAAAAAKIEAAEGFSVLTHERVVTVVNRRLGTPEGRAKLKLALERMRGHRSTIDPILAAHKLPRALIAVAMQESGFDNQARSNRPPERQSAGIWQLIPTTGRALGLSVTPALDERLDPKRATEAAATLLAQLYQRFGDWPVAIAAYNAGQKLIEPMVAGLSREEARRRLLESDTEFGQYLVGVMASVILCENPALVD
jgi:membrane-bound lytic murein transglycosylase D